MKSIDISLEDLAKYCAMLSAAMTSTLTGHVCSREELLDLYNTHLESICETRKIVLVIETFNELTRR